MAQPCRDQHQRRLTVSKFKIERWRHDYNDQRSHSMLGYMTPNQYALSAAEDGTPGIQEGHFF